jgi:hypothetical protein
VSKTLAALPPLPLPRDAAAVLAHRRAGERVAEAIAYYAPPRLPADLWARHALAPGAMLTGNGQHELAVTACFAPVVDLLAAAPCAECVPVPYASGATTSGRRAPGSQQYGAPAPTPCEPLLSARLGRATCGGAAALARDPRAAHAPTLAAVRVALEAAKAVAAEALPHESLYYIVHNAAVAIMQLGQALVDGGFAGTALPALVFAAKALGGPLALAAPRHLPLRTRLYAAAVHAYHEVLTAAAAEAANSTACSSPAFGCNQAPGTAAGAAAAEARHPAVTPQHAEAFLEGGIRELEHLVAIQGLDPVPPAPETATALAAAHAELLLLRPLVAAAGEVHAGGTNSANAAATPGSEAAALIHVSPPQLLPPGPGEHQPQQGEVSLQRAALRDAMTGLPSQGAKLRALASLLASASGGRCPLRRDPAGPPMALRPVLEEAWQVAAPALAALRRLLEPATSSAATDMPPASRPPSSAASGAPRAAGKPGQLRAASAKEGQRGDALRSRKQPAPAANAVAEEHQAVAAAAGAERHLAGSNSADEEQSAIAAAAQEAIALLRPGVHQVI